MIVSLAACAVAPAGAHGESSLTGGAGQAKKGSTGATGPEGAPRAVTTMIGSLANIGDSISQGFDADDADAIDLDRAQTNASDVFHDSPEYSWVQGSDPRVGSVADHYRRLNAKLVVTPVSHTGAEMVTSYPDKPNFAEQAAMLVQRDAHPDLVYVLLGGNDVCGRELSSDDDPTSTLYSVATWTQAVDDGLAVLAAGLDSGATVRVASMPHVDRLYDQAGGASVDMRYGFVSGSVSCRDFWVTAAMAGTTICPIVTTDAIPAHHAAIGARIDQYNDALAAEIHRFANDRALNPKGIRFQTDWHGSVASGAAENSSIGTLDFEANDISTRDCFHPSIAGQKKLANLVLNVATWE